MNLGCRSITRAEMRAIVEGLSSLGLSVYERFKFNWTLQQLSRFFARASSVLEHQNATLIMQFQDLYKQQWEVTLTHIYRETNYDADYLANLYHSYVFGLHILDSRDRSLSQ
ncbi:hypothetical protein LINGRAHAP2_LOCUS24695 [Linum grandiflorum]